jgi:excisionase family DNA binding protein
MSENNSNSRFMTVRQVAEYLQLNEKKIYTLATEEKIPATKVAGKWMFPRELIDRWMLESAHGGVFTDRLVIAGSEDPLLYRTLLRLSNNMKSHALVSYTGTGTRLGLELLSAQKVNASCLNWGEVEESPQRHPALLQNYKQHQQWVLVRAFKRERGFMIHPDRKPADCSSESLLRSELKWGIRQDGSGTLHFLNELLAQHSMKIKDLSSTVKVFSNRETAALIVSGQVDAATGTRSVATEFGLAFVELGWEALDFAVRRDVYFRKIFQTFLEHLRSQVILKQARQLGGYNFSESGKLIWGGEH